MANRDIKTTIKLEGEQQFKQAMKGASDAIKVLNSEQKLAQAQFEATGNKEQFMADKADILRRKIEEQQKAVNAAQEAVNKLKEQGVDPTNKAMQDWTTKLNTAKAYLTRLEGQLNATESELAGQGDAFEDASAAAADYNDELQNIGKGIDFQNVTAILDSMHQRLEKALDMVTSVSTAIYNAVQDAGKWADEIATESQIAGLDVETYQSWLYASRFIDTNVSDIISARQRLLKNLTSDNKETVKLFNDLKVVTRQTNGDIRNYGDVFWDVIDALGNVEDITMRDYYAQQLLGKGAKDLAPLINAGSEAYKAAAEEGRQYAVVSEENVAKLGAFDDAQQKLAATLEATKNDIATALAEPFTDLSNAIAEVLKQFREFLQTDEGQALLGRITEAVQGLVDSITSVDFEAIMTKAAGAVDLLTSALSWIADNGWVVVAVLAGIKGIMGTITLGKGILQALQLIKSINWLNMQKGAKSLGDALGKGASETAKEAAGGGGGLLQTGRALFGKLGEFLAMNAGKIGVGVTAVGSLYLADKLDQAYTENRYGDYNKTLDNYDAYFFDTADKKIQRMQSVMDEFKRAEEYEDENGSVDIERIKNAFRFNANAILEALPELDFWDYVRESADLSNGLNAEEIENIIGLDYLSGMTWEDLAMDVVAGLAKGIEGNASTASDAAADMAQGIQDAVTDTLDINSPSVVMFEDGMNVALGLADGINARAAVAIAAAANLAAQVQAALNSAGAVSIGGYSSAIGGALYTRPSYSAYGGGAGGSAGGGVANVTLMMDKQVVGSAVAPIVNRSLGTEISMLRG